MARDHSDENNQFQEQVNTLVAAFNLIFNESLNLTPMQDVYKAGASDALKNEKFVISQPSMGESLHPFQTMVNELLKKGIITKKDTMRSLGRSLVDNKGKLDKNAVQSIFIAAEYLGVLTQNPKKYLDVLNAAKLGFKKVVALNKITSSNQVQVTSTAPDESLMEALRRVSDIKDPLLHQAGMKEVFKKMNLGRYPGTIQHDQKESNSSESSIKIK